MTISFLGFPMAALLVCGIIASVCVIGLVCAFFISRIRKRAKVVRRQRNVEVKMTKLLDDLSRRSAKIEELEREEITGFFRRRRQAREIRRLKREANRETGPDFLDYGKENERLIDIRNRISSRRRGRCDAEIIEFDPILKRLYSALQAAKPKERYRYRVVGNVVNIYTPPVSGGRRRGREAEPTVVVPTVVEPTVIIPPSAESITTDSTGGPVPTAS